MGVAALSPVRSSVTGCYTNGRRGIRTPDILRGRQALRTAELFARAIGGAEVLKGQAYGKQNAVAQDEQHRRERRRSSRQQPVTQNERHHRSAENDVVLRSEAQARTRESLVCHKRLESIP